MANITRRPERSLSQNRSGLDPLRGTFDPFQMMREMLRWDPYQDLGRMGGINREMMFVPDFDVKERDDAYLLQADLPGVRKDDLDISVAGDRITISGTRQNEERQENEQWHAVERSYGTFTRSFILPEGIRTDDVQAELTNGVLNITVPKRPEVQPRKVEVKGEGAPKQVQARGNGGQQAQGQGRQQPQQKT